MRLLLDHRSCHFLSAAPLGLLLDQAIGLSQAEVDFSNGRNFVLIGVRPLRILRDSIEYFKL
jgi:hypothetical protein